ncbi:MAG: hypothetical protein GY839_10325 [candidate division Zixibacteria bacterium]|nr:hypothetical protein [candidate division Zixibacteria bacterium]
MSDFFDKFDKIERIVEAGYSESIVQELEILLIDNALSNLFLNSISDSRWFHFLKEKGYFDPYNAPGPLPALDQDGFVIPEWNVLPYLEHVSKKSNEPKSEQYVDELLEIVRNVTKFRNDKGERTDNPRTWWYFVKIICNLPNEKIGIDILKFIPDWLETRFNFSLADAEITNKLLPKFLPDNSTNEDKEKAEFIFNEVIKIKWISDDEKEKSPYISSTKDFNTIIDTHWLGDSLIDNKNAFKIGQLCSMKPIYNISDLLSSIFSKKFPSKAIEESSNGTKYQIEFEFDSDNYCIASIRKLANSTKEFENIGSYKSVKRCNEIADFGLFFIDELSNNVLLEDIKSKLQDIDPFNLYNEIIFDHSYLWVKSLRNRIGGYKDEPLDTLVDIAKEIIRAKVQNPAEDSNFDEVIRDFLGKKYHYAIFIRFVLYICDVGWNKYKTRFWELIEGPFKEQIFSNLHYEAEVYSLLESNIHSFSNAEKGKLEGIIESLSFAKRLKDIDSHEIEKAKKYWRQKWYSSLKSDEHFKKLYIDLKEETKIEEEYMFRERAVKIGSGPSPLTKDEIITKLEDGTLIDYFNSFKTEHPWKGPTTAGLAEAFQEIVKDNPELLIDNIEQFVKVNYYYNYHAFLAIRDAFNEKKQINWEKLLTFIKLYISQDEFKNNKLTQGESERDANNKWIIQTIGWLIRDGCTDDNWAIPLEYYDILKEILIIAINSQDMKKTEAHNNPVAEALNTAYGCSLSAIVYLELRRLRVAGIKDKSLKPLMDDELKILYDSCLDNNIPEAYTIIGQFFPNLSFIDSVWTMKKIKYFKELKDESLWYAFMYGYLFGCRQNTGSYRFMTDHYTRALSLKKTDDEFRELLSDHISVGYILSHLTGFDKFDLKGLFGELIKNWNYEIIEHILSSFRREGYAIKERELVKENDKDILNRILKFWELIYDKYKDEDPDKFTIDDKKLLADTANFLDLIDVIDEKYYKMLLLSAPYIHTNWNEPRFIKKLNIIKDNGDKKKISEFVGKIFLVMSKTYLPDFKKEHIEELVKFLFENGNRSDAVRICEAYAKKGSFFLKELYDKFEK